MTSHIDDRLPFYINRTMGDDEITLVEAHLATCLECRQQLEEWQTLSKAVNQMVDELQVAAQSQPGLSKTALSPLVSASLKRRPPVQQAIPSAVNLIWAQRVLLRYGWLTPALVSVTMLSALAVLVLHSLAPEWVALPLLIAAPIAAALSTAFLYTFEEDPVGEIISATPTTLGTLIFARLTLAVGGISLLTFLGSLVLVIFGRSAHSLFDLVAVWLGPMLLLSALTTVVSLCLHPRAASAVALAFWGSILILLFSEQAGEPMLRISFLWLLHPDWPGLVAQVLLACILWLVSWLWLAGNTPSYLQLDGEM
jgi:hypothetical protein